MIAFILVGIFNLSYLSTLCVLIIRFGSHHLDRCLLLLQLSVFDSFGASENHRQLWHLVIKELTMNIGFPLITSSPNLCAAAKVEAS